MTTEGTTTPGWVTSAAKLPLGFAQVREDPELDRAVVERAGQGARIVMVASGGCTAAALAGGSTVAWLHVVDPNRSHIALTLLKLRLLATTPPGERLALLGHAPMRMAARRHWLTTTMDALGFPGDILGPEDLVAELGADHAGRYERLFARLRTELSPHAEDVEALLALHDPRAQTLAVAPEAPLGRALDEAFAEVMALPNLVSLFGDGATRNPREPFSAHFARRTRWALAHQPAADNPFLAQMLLGRFAPGAEHAWLRAVTPDRMPDVTVSITPMVEALAAAPGTFDVVHLSNILDWLSPEAARSTLELAWAALRTGGWIIIRQLNSTLDIPALGEQFHWRNEGATLLARDRSFFYRAVHVGTRR